MRRVITIIIIFISCSVSLAAQDTIILQGHYYGKNLFVINPSVKASNSFCVTRVFVNDLESKDELLSNSFEVDFSLLNISVGTAVRVIIMHDSACYPKVINPEVLQPQSNFAFLNTKIDKTLKLIWTVKGELYSPFTIEQFRWKKWITLAEVDLSDTVKKNIYDYEIRPHFGVNQFRISQTDAKGIIVYSKIIKYRSATLKEITLASTKVSDVLTFSAETAYEIFDEKGTFIMDGFGLEVNISDLSKGKYWVNYDNKTEMVTKK